MLFLRISQENLHGATNLAEWNTNYICRIGFKTNQPSSETMIFNADTNNGAVGLLCVLSNATVLGDWSLTFTSATDFTISAPGGASASGKIPADVAQNVFNDGMCCYFGHQPNSRANIYMDATSQTLTLNRIWITNSSGVKIDDSFGAPPLDANAWAICAAVPSTIWIVPTNAWRIADWGAPATGFTLSTTANLADPNSWVDLSFETTNAIQPTTQKLTYITNGLPSLDRGFFAMVKRVGARLQILLPGESNAPGTPSGKTGVPTPQTIGVPFDLTVNMCDETWHIVSSSDTVAITSTDLSAGLPPDATLANGTVTISANFYFGSAGTWMVKASDVTTPAITSSTSTAIIIP